MNTGTHNPNYQKDFISLTWTKEQENNYLLEINKRDFFSMVENYYPLDRYSEEQDEELIISDNLGNDVYIIFKPTFNVTYSDNFTTGCPTYDREETHILIKEIVYTKSYSSKEVLTASDFTDEEFNKLENMIRIMCQ